MNDRNAGADDSHVSFYDAPLYDDHAIIYNKYQLLDQGKLKGSRWRWMKRTGEVWVNGIFQQRCSQTTNYKNTGKGKKKNLLLRQLGILTMILIRTGKLTQA